MTPETNDQTDNRISRRAWLDLALAAGGAIWGLGMAVPAAFYLWPARAAGPSQTVLKVGPLNSLAVGEAKMLQADGRPLVVLRAAADRVVAFSAICPHLGCVVAWDAGRKVFACPCHAGVFSPEGKVMAGPPPKPLQEYPVMVIGDEIRVKVG